MKFGEKLRAGWKEWPAVVRWVAVLLPIVIVLGVIASKGGVS